MAAFHPPNDPIWRSNKHQFASIPPNVQGYIRDQLRLPPEQSEKLLPPENIHELHNADVSILARLTVPPRTVLAILVKDGKQAWLDGSLSKFFNIRRLLRTIDDDDNDRKAQDNYDESEEEEEVTLRGPDEDPTTLPSPVAPSSELPLEKEVDLDLTSPELKQILSDAPLVRKTKKSILVPSVEEGEEDGGSFELGAWV